MYGRSIVAPHARTDSPTLALLLFSMSTTEAPAIRQARCRLAPSQVFSAPLFASNSSTRRSNCSTRSSSIRLAFRQSRRRVEALFSAASQLHPPSAIRFLRRAASVCSSSAVIREHATRRAQNRNPRHRKHTHPLTFFVNEPIAVSLQRVVEPGPQTSTHAPHYHVHNERTHASAALLKVKRSHTSLPSHVRETAVRKHQAQR